MIAGCVTPCNFSSNLCRNKIARQAARKIVQCNTAFNHVCRFLLLEMFQKIVFFRDLQRAFLDRVGKLLGTSLIFRHYSRIFSHYGECCVLFCDFEAWKGLNYVTSWVKTSLSLVIPILFARRTVWYKCCANCIVFSHSWVTLSLQYWEAGFKSVSKQVKRLKFSLIYVIYMYWTMALVFRIVYIVSCLETYKNSVYFGGLLWCRPIFQIYPIMQYGR